jgi:FkbM family methyltransferase
MAIAQPASDFGRYRMRPLLTFLLHDKRVPSFARRMLRAVFRNQKSDIELDGIKFRCYPNQNHHDRAIASGTLFRTEGEEYRFMEAALQNGGVFADIGANIGAVFIPLSVRAKAPVQVIAIEPNPDNIQRLTYNAKLNGIGNLTVMPYAVGPSGKVRLWTNNASNSGQSSLYDYGKGKSLGYIEVEARPLLDILKEAHVTTISLLKIDIEGYEDKALIPFFKEAPRVLWPKAVIVEHAHRHVWQDDCIAAMEARGYAVQKATKGNTMLTLAS